MRVNTDYITSNGNTMPTMDIIQWLHKHNKFNHAFGISFRPDDRGRVRSYVETNDIQIINAILAQWPNAKVEAAE
jgi:hypothetical protein